MVKARTCELRVAVTQLNVNESSTIVQRFAMPFYKVRGSTKPWLSIRCSFV